VLVVMAGAGYTHGAMVVEVSSDVNGLWRRIESESQADEWHADTWVACEAE